MAGHRRAVGSWLAAIAPIAAVSHAQTPSSCDVTGPATAVQPVDSFDWPLASGSYPYSRLAAARSAMGEGSAYLVTTLARNRE